MFPETKRALADLRRQWRWWRIERKIGWVIAHAPTDEVGGLDLVDTLLPWLERQGPHIMQDKP